MKKSYEIGRRLLLFLFFILVYSCKNERPSYPIVDTTAVTAVSSSTATCGGEIKTDGGGQILARGVCWSSESNPTLADNTTSDGTGVGAFTSIITGLKTGFTYYFRAYAINRAGTSYGETISFTTLTVDYDGNIYEIIAIGSQVWMTENLKVTRYRNGDFIETTNPISLDVSGATDPKYQWGYNGDESYSAVYGRLYTWFAAVDNRGVCPEGWHIPNDSEWKTLIDYLIKNSYGYEGSGTDIAKSVAASTGWLTSTVVGAPGNDQASNNSSGFSALAGGFRYPRAEGHFDAAFGNLGYSGNWWSSLDPISGLPGVIMLRSDYSDITTYFHTFKIAASVRCIRDSI